MVRAVRSAIIAVGDELLSGRTRDVNMHAIGGLLNRRGLPSCEARVVRDDLTEISRALGELLTPGTLVVTTGGLGPTSDDITLEGVALALGLPLSVSPEAVRMIESRYSDAGRPLPPGSLAQAVLPEGALPVRNPAGVAPGVLLFHGGSVLICLPGVPREARELLPLCLDAAGIPDARHRECFVRTWGIREIDLYNMVKPIQESFGALPAYLPSPGRVDMGFHGPNAEEFRERVVSLLGSRVYSLERDETLEEAVGRELASRGLMAATAESCTGGMVSAGLTGVPGASSWYAGGVVAYSNLLKTGLLNVPAELLETCGAVSSEVALAMASGVRKVTGADCAVAVTGIAGPSGGTPDKPVGTVWTAACCGTLTSCSSWLFHGDRDSVRLAASACALGMLLELVRRDR